MPKTKKNSTTPAYRLGFESQEVSDDDWAVNVPPRDPASPDHEANLDDAEDAEPEQRTPIVGMNPHEAPPPTEVRTSSGRKTKAPSKVSPKCVLDAFSQKPADPLVSP